MKNNDYPIVSHLSEIRYRMIYILYSIIVTSISAYCYKEEIFYLLSKPLGKYFIYTDIIEAFVTYIKLSLITGIYLTFPIVLYQVWSFIVPGLYLYEKKIYRILFAVSITLYIVATLSGYTLLFPITYAFFLGFQKIGTDKLFNIELQAKVNEYILFNTKLIFALSLSFQLPIFIFFIWKWNPSISTWLIKRRRFIYVVSFILAAILSPPDILSQLIIAIPLVIFFEISIFIVKLFDKYKTFMEIIGIEPTT